MGAFRKIDTGDIAGHLGVQVHLAERYRGGRIFVIIQYRLRGSGDQVYGGGGGGRSRLLATGKQARESKQQHTRLDSIHENHLFFLLFISGEWEQRPWPAPGLFYSTIIGIMHWYILFQR